MFTLHTADETKQVNLTCGGDADNFTLHKWGDTDNATWKVTPNNFASKGNRTKKVTFHIGGNLLFVTLSDMLWFILHIGNDVPHAGGNFTFKRLIFSSEFDLQVGNDSLLIGV